MNRQDHASEHQEQVALFRWAEYATGRWPVLALLYAIPNGGLRPFRERTDRHGRRVRYSVEGQKLRAEGVKDGVPDVCLPVPRGPFHGLYIEMKTRRGTTSPAQRRWLAALERHGYRTAVCHGWEAAREVIVDYLGPARETSCRRPACPPPVGGYSAPRREGLEIVTEGERHDHC